MELPAKIIRAFRSKHIPDRYLSTASNDVLDMFSNQICVSLEVTAHSNGFHLQRFEIEDEIRAKFMEKIFTWTEEEPTDGRWSVVSHGTTSEGDGSFKSIFGFLFEDEDDAERFLTRFVMVEKLKS